MFNDALLLDVAEPREYDLVSATAMRWATWAAACCLR